MLARNYWGWDRPGATMALSVNANGDVPDGKIIFAEFERAMIAERARAGMARAKSQGKHCGRPCHEARCAGFPGQGQGHLQHGPGSRCWRCHSSAHQAEMA